MAKSKEQMRYSYSDAAGNRHCVDVAEAKFGWKVTIRENAAIVRSYADMGSLATVMARAIEGGR